MAGRRDREDAQRAEDGGWRGRKVGLGLSEEAVAELDEWMRERAEKQAAPAAE